MKKIKKMMILIVIVFSLIYIVQAILDFHLYRILIRLSVIPIILLPKIFRKLKFFSISEFNEICYITYVFLAHFLGSVINLYHQFYWYDNLMHFLSGIVVSLFSLELLIKLKKYDSNQMIFNTIFILAMGFMVSGLWEYFEFISDHLFHQDAQNALTTGVNDTMIDMILATLGNCLFLITFKQKKIRDQYVILLKSKS